MKQVFWSAALCALLACMTACGGSAATIPVSMPLGAGETSAVSSSGSTAPPSQPSSAAVEQPEETASLDFLSPEQALVYQKAVDSTLYMLGGGVNLVGLPGVEPGKEVRIDDIPYCLLSGKFQTYEDLRAYVLETFTENCLKQLNFDSSFVSYNGQLAANDSGLGSNSNLSELPDTYRLLQSTDTVVEFTLIGHYTFLRENESVEEYMQRQASSWDKTREFPIRLVLTEQGWRVDEFHHPAYW